MARKTRKPKYTAEKLLEAIADVKNGTLSQRRASAKYEIPQSTIADRITGRYAPKILKSGLFYTLPYLTILTLKSCLTFNCRVQY